ncbi:MAG TPA: glycosyltransferase [Candidatus Saccharimonadales bacterium]|nr:glycosyltransferase [Candidatus Saccharimonadales bacterium]
MKVVCIIPTYNEKENITRMLDVMLRVISRQKKDRYVVLVVDDNSPDGTGELVKKYKSRKIFLLSGKKEGLGKAMIRGYKYATQKLGADIVVSNEADFAFDPYIIPSMVKKIKEGYDVVIGSRHVGDGRTEGWTLNRRLNHWIANKFFATWVAGVNNVYDHNGAFRAIRVDGVLDKIEFNKLKVSGFGFFNYSLFKLTQVTDKFYEFPVVYKFREKGESKVSLNPKYFRTYLNDVWEYVVLSLQIRSEKLRTRK